MSTRDISESGLLTDRLEIVREDVTGEVPADPDWMKPSDDVRELTWTPGPGVEARDQLGSPDPSRHDKSNEEHEIEYVYGLQRPLVDPGGAPNDPSADALSRDADHVIPYTHSLIARDERTRAVPSDPSDVAGARIYLVGKGLRPDAEIELDPEDGGAAEATLTNNAEKARSYEILQPADPSALTVESQNSDDIGLDVTIENEGGGTAETVTLTEETDVDGNFVAANATTASTFGDIDAVEAASEPTGEVTVSIDAGSTLMTLHGSLYYSNDDKQLEGDLGVPALGAGSRGAPVENTYPNFEEAQGTRITRGGQELDYDLLRMTLSSENDMDPTPRTDSVRNRYHEGNREVQLETDLIGWGVSHELIDDALVARAENMVIELDKSNVRLNNATNVEPGDRERAGDDTAVEYSATFEPSDPEGTGNAVELVNTE